MTTKDEQLVSLPKEFMLRLTGRNCRSCNCKSYDSDTSFNKFIGTIRVEEGRKSLIGETKKNYTGQASGRKTHLWKDRFGEGSVSCPLLDNTI